MEIITREDLVQIFSEFERRILTAISSTRPEQIADTDKEWLSVDEAVAFLDSQGYRTTKKYIYQLRYRDAIPYARINGKLSFNKNSLRSWAEKQRTFDSEKSKRDAAALMRHEAQRKSAHKIRTV